MYFNVNFNVFFKLIKVHFSVKKLHTLRNFVCKLRILKIALICK